MAGITLSEAQATAKLFAPTLGAQTILRKGHKYAVCSEVSHARYLKFGFVVVETVTAEAR
jgi:hypothetical protein